MKQITTQHFCRRSLVHKFRTLLLLLKPISFCYLGGRNFAVLILSPRGPSLPLTCVIPRLTNMSLALMENMRWLLALAAAPVSTHPPGQWSLTLTAQYNLKALKKDARLNFRDSNSSGKRLRRTS